MPFFLCLVMFLNVSRGMEKGFLETQSIKGIKVKKLGVLCFYVVKIEPLE
jgi:hypothetical protein